MQAVLVAAAILLIVIGAVAVTVSGEWWLTPLAADWGGIDSMLTATTVATGLVFVGLNLFLAYLVVRFSSDKVERASSEHDNPKLEWALIGVTALAIVALLAPGLLVYGQVVALPEDAAEDNLVVEVVGQQWNWNYRYPGEDGRLGAARNDLFGPDNPMGVDPGDPAVLDDRWVPGGPLVVPVDEPVRLQLRSRDVIHIFFVPNFRVKQAAMPGMMNEMWFTPTETGEYDAVCTEFCGIAHHGMVGRVQVVERDEYEEWLAQQQRVGEALGLVEEAEETDADEAGEEATPADSRT